MNVLRFGGFFQGAQKWLKAGFYDGFDNADRKLVLALRWGRGAHGGERRDD